MATHRLKDVSILKTGTCQGISQCLLNNTFFHTKQHTKYITTHNDFDVIFHQGLSRTQCLHHTSLLFF